jgi:hypothetical protein
MRKLTLPLVLVCAAVMLAVPSAFASGGQQLTGKISAVSDSQVTVVNGDSSLTCAVPTVKNYSLSAHFHVGDVVRLECKLTDAGKLVLSGLHRQGINEHPAKGTGDGAGKQLLPAPVNGTVSHVQGKISAVSDTQITVADGAASLTCAVPTVKNYSLSAHFHVGDAVRLECKQTDAGLVMTALHRQGGDQPKPTAPPTGDSGTPQPQPTGDKGKGTEPQPQPQPPAPGTPQPPANQIGGTVSAVSDTQVTVADGGRSLTCTAVGDLHPSALVHVGDHVLLQCKQTDAGALVIVSLRKATGDTPSTPAPAPPTTTNPSPVPPAGGDHK